MRHIGLFYLGILLSFPVLNAQSEVDLKELDRYYEQMVRDWDVPGASIGIVREGELIFTGNYGVLEKGKGRKPDEHTLYAIASNSKAFTSAMIGMLVQEGKLDWDDKVRDYLPYFALYDPWVSAHVTVRDLLSHRVGLGTFSGDNIWYKSELSDTEIIKRIRFVPQAFEFRAGYGYSNLMFITAGELIEKVTGRSWGQNVQERILDPLGMARTIWTLNDLESKGNFSSPHARKDGSNFAIPWVSWDNVAATGGLISSVSDISRWMIFNLNHGIIGQDTLLTTSTRNEVWTVHNNFPIDRTTENDFRRHFSGYGLGWGLSDYHGRLRLSHTGGYDGFITAITLIPEEKLGVVVLTNGVRSPIMAATYYALDRFLDVEVAKDWSGDLLAQRKRQEEGDTRIADRKASRVIGSQPTLSVGAILGTYKSDLTGEITIRKQGETLRMEFEHQPLLSATLTHWHYDTWEIHWEHPQAWFSFGTIQFRADNNREITGFDFDVPNDDFFFEELKPYRIRPGE